jgi:hypothetical protein
MARSGDRAADERSRDERHERRQADRGLDLFVSSAAWSPGHHGPDGEWERISATSGVAVVVCNRTGRDLFMDCTPAESVVCIEGLRVITMTSDEPCVFVVELDRAGPVPTARLVQRVLLHDAISR